MNSLNLNQDDQVVGVEWLGVCVRGLLLCRRISPCLRPSLKDVRNYDTPIREQHAAVTVFIFYSDEITIDVKTGLVTRLKN